MTVRGGSRGGGRKTERAARRTEAPRAGNTGRVKPLEWSLHQSGRHNLRPIYSILKRPHAYGPVTARIRLSVIRSMDVMASQSQHKLTSFVSVQIKPNNGSFQQSDPNNYLLLCTGKNAFHCTEKKNLSLHACGKCRTNDFKLDDIFHFRKCTVLRF